MGTRSKREKERPEGEATLKLLFENNPLPLWMYDLETLKFLDVNEVACRNYGYSRSEFLNLTIQDIRPPEDIPGVLASVRDTPKDVFNSGLWRHRKKDGTLITVEILSHEIEYRGRRARLVCPLAVTERQRSQATHAMLAEALRESEAGLRHAQRMAMLAHAATSPDGSFESWSETMPMLLGVDEERMPRTTREWLAFVHPADREKCRSTAIAAGASGKRGHVEYRLQRVDGTWIHVRHALEPIHGSADANGRMRWFSTLQDVTEQTRAQTSVRRLNRVYAMLSAINTLIVRVNDRRDLYRETCRIAVELGGFQWPGSELSIQRPDASIRSRGMEQARITWP